MQLDDVWHSPLASAEHASDDGAEVGGGDGARAARPRARRARAAASKPSARVGAGVCLVRHTDDDVFHIQLDDV